MDVQALGEQLQALVDKTLERQKHVFNIVLGVSSSRMGFEWCGAAGKADVSGDTQMTPDTPFLIASVTKMYTAATIMILEDRGKLDLHDRISVYLPGDLIKGLHHYRGTDYTDSLTIRHLISHTSGLPDYFLERPKNGKSALEQLLEEGDRAWRLEDVVRLTRDAFPAKFAPPELNEGDGAGRKRRKAHYSDTNYKLLGEIIESITDEPLQAVFEQLFFEPLDLNETYLYGHRPASAEAPALVYYNDRSLVIDELMSSHGPEGGIVSTVDETLRFGQAFMSGELFADNDTLDRMQQWNKLFFPLQYGYGLMRFKMPKLLSPFGYSPELIGHSGSSGSFLYYDRELNLYLAGTLNQMTLRNMPFQLMIKATQIYKKRLSE